MKGPRGAHRVRHAVLGGMFRHNCTWSGIACPSTSSTPSCSHSFRSTPPICLRNCPKIDSFRYFGTNTTWYLQYHFTWDRLAHSLKAVAFPWTG